MRHTGTIKHFNAQTGLGGITPDDPSILPGPQTEEDVARGVGPGSDVVLMHWSDVGEGYVPAKGDRVSFDAVQAHHTSAVGVRREAAEVCRP